MNKGNDQHEYESEDDYQANGWIQWFCNLENHRFLIEVEEDYLRDNFNLYGLRQ